MEVEKKKFKLKDFLKENKYKYVFIGLNLAIATNGHWLMLLKEKNPSEYSEIPDEDSLVSFGIEYPELKEFLNREKYIEVGVDVDSLLFLLKEVKEMGIKKVNLSIDEEKVITRIDGEEEDISFTGFVALLKR